MWPTHALSAIFRRGRIATLISQMSFRGSSLIVVAAVAAALWGRGAVPRRALGAEPAASPPVSLRIEAEAFRPASGSAWRQIAVGENYYWATLANTFISRQKL